MDKTIKFPVLVADRLLFQLERLAEYFAKYFERDIYPIIHRFGLLDDEHIRKYMECDTVEEIYKDAMAKDADGLLYAEKAALYSDTDIWAPIRDKNSPVKSPREEGFIFAQTPLSGHEYKKYVIKALSVKDGHILIDKEILLDESIIKPTDKQRELYELVLNFCKDLEQMKESTRLPGTLFIYQNGKIRPNINGILNRIFCSEIRRRPKV